MYETDVGFKAAFSEQRWEFEPKRWSVLKKMLTSKIKDVNLGEMDLAAFGEQKEVSA